MRPTDRLCQIVEVQNPQVAMKPSPLRQIVSAKSDRPISVTTISKASGISARLLSACQMQGNACHWCGHPFRFDQGSEHELAPSREHATPRSLGGTKILGIVHRRCNAIRGIIDQEAFRRIMDGEAVTREDCWPHLFPRNAAGDANVSDG
jgi:hypothetical protein